jgi:hypothetical protein
MLNVSIIAISIITFGIMAFSVMTFSIQDSVVTININDSQLINTLSGSIMLNVALYVFFELNVVLLDVVAPFPLPPSPSLSILGYGNVSLSVGY